MADKFVTLPEIRKHAKKVLPRDVWNFGDGAAESETTTRRNRRAVDRLAIRQDILVDVREIDLRTSLLGLPLSWPVVIAPMGGLILFHPEGDREMARGAAQGDTLQFLSGAAGWSVEDVAAASPGPKMFQLYHHGDRTWAADLLARVEASGYQSVVPHRGRAGLRPARARHRPPLQPARRHVEGAQPARPRRQLSRSGSPGTTSRGSRRRRGCPSASRAS